eukprot:13461711-Ditylum_brightwellii.AAC.1
MASTNDLREYTAGVLSQLFAAMEEDCTMVSNLTDTNHQLTEKVANITTKLTTIGKEIAALKKSINDLTEAMQVFTTTQYKPTGQNSGKQQWTIQTDLKSQLYAIIHA